MSEKEDDPIDDTAFELAAVAMALAAERGICLPCLLAHLHMRASQGLAEGALRHRQSCPHREVKQ